MKSIKPRLKDIAALIFSFLLAGMIVGLSVGLMDVTRNAYVQRGMIEIAIWTLTGSLNHHLILFLIMGTAGSFLFSLLIVLGVPPARSFYFGVLPLTAIGVVYFYAIPTAHVLYPFLPVVKRKIAGAGIAASLGIVTGGGVLLWFAMFRARARSYWKRCLSVSMGHLRVLAVVCLVVIAANAFDFPNWSRSLHRADNVLIISIDTLRPDFLGCYGSQENLSPNIDRFAEENIRFSHAVSQSSWTLPAHASLFTGVYPSTHGAYNRRRRISNRLLLLSETLRNAGYTTAAFTGGGYLAPNFGFGQGFGRYGEKTVRIDSDEIKHFLEDGRNEPFFLFIHTYQVHDYSIPEELWEDVGGDYGGRFPDLESIRSFLNEYAFKDLDDRSWRAMEYLRNRYSVSISWMDRQFADLMNLLEDRGLMDRTLVILLSDHGEEFGEHGRTLHGVTLFEEQTHVPLVMHLPGGPAGPEIIDDITEMIDVAPTVLDYLGLPVPDGIDGMSLLPLISGGENTGDGLAFSEITNAGIERFSVCNDSLKLIYTLSAGKDTAATVGELEAYHLTWGPGWSEVPTDAEDSVLVENFFGWYEKRRAERSAGESANEIFLDPALQDKLQALGYIQ